MHFESVDELVLHLKKLVIKQKHHLSTFHCPNSSPGAQGLGGVGDNLGKSHYYISLTIGQTIYGTITVPIFSIVIWLVNAYLVSKDHNTIVGLAS